MPGFLEWARQKRSFFLIDILQLFVVFVLVDLKIRLITFPGKLLMPNFVSEKRKHN